MPWTFAHPAAVLPFRRFGSRRVPFAGLVAGSMAPDIGYYFGRYDVGAFAHAPMGVVLFCVPVSMVLVLVVIRLRTLLTAPLPQPHRSALRAIEPFVPSSPRSLAALAAAALLGAVTHIVWDAFTHAPGTTTHSFAFLGRNALALGGHTFYVHNLVQYASTLAGLAFLAAAYRRWLNGNPSRHSPGGEDRPRIAAVASSAILATACGFAVSMFTSPMRETVAGVVVRGVTYGTALFVAAWLALAITFARRESRPAHEPC